MSTQFKILSGILFTIGTIVALVILWVNEDARMARKQAEFNGRLIEVGAENYATYCYTCHGERGEGIPGMGPPLNRKDMLDTKKAPYLRSIKFGGTLEDFLHDTIAAGRPLSSQFYASQNYINAMQTWGQDYGGPLRPDQIDSLVAFIRNWAPGDYEPLVPISGSVSIPITGTGKAPFDLPPSDTVIEAGKKVFAEKCVACHGAAGDGKGPAAAALSKKPRNFTDCAAMEQFTMNQHYDAVFNGRTTTNMPAWKGNLSDEQIWQVIVYERSFCKLYTP